MFTVAGVSPFRRKVSSFNQAETRTTPTATKGSKNKKSQCLSALLLSDWLSYCHVLRQGAAFQPRGPADVCAAAPGCSPPVREPKPEGCLGDSCSTAAAAAPAPAFPVAGEG